MSASPAAEPAAACRLTICGLQELCAFTDASVTDVLSILYTLAPEPADFAAYGPHQRLTLRFDDIIEPMVGMVLPEREHVVSLLRFGEGLAADGGDPLSHLLIHCHAGISRSTASMATLIAEARPEADEDAIFAEIRKIRPQSWPNSRMIAFADDLLGRGGRLTAALQRHYREQIHLKPELAQMIERVGRGKEVRTAA